MGQNKGHKLVKIVVKENGKTVMELIPTKENESKARRMQCIGYEVVRIYG